MQHHLRLLDPPPRQASALDEVLPPRLDALGGQRLERRVRAEHIHDVAGATVRGSRGPCSPFGCGRWRYSEATHNVLRRASSPAPAQLRRGGAAQATAASRAREQASSLAGRAPRRASDASCSARAVPRTRTPHHRPARRRRPESFACASPSTRWCARFPSRQYAYHRRAPRGPFNCRWPDTRTDLVLGASSGRRVRRADRRIALQETRRKHRGRRAHAPQGANSLYTSIFGDGPGGDRTHARRIMSSALPVARGSRARF